jgi:Fe-S cluster assembly protein SufD
LPNENVIRVPDGVTVEEPILVRSPHTVVHAGAGSRVTLIERLEIEPGATVIGSTEIVTGERADVTYAAAQFAPDDARVTFTRTARPGKDARVLWAIAELGAAASESEIGVTLDERGADAQIATLFFPTGTQNIGMVSTVDHRVGDATSETVVKTAASGHGRGRYLGNIRIAKDAQQSNASLRDDALLLSPTAHIESVPALEIAANDVKAFHGATVGALDAESIFYMTSRGIDRAQAERMIALGFFEPAIERFPTEALREELRAALEAKVAP